MSLRKFDISTTIFRKLKYYLLVVIALVFVCLVVFRKDAKEFFELLFVVATNPNLIHSQDSKLSIQHPQFIAHAGGSFQCPNYSNSLKVMDASWISGVRWFEIDLFPSIDDSIECIHDWNASWKPNIGVPNHSEFMLLRKALPCQPMTFSELEAWLTSHHTAFLITDFKSRQLDFLHRVRKDTTISKRIIPQAYSYKEYMALSRSGYSNVILTVYKNSYSIWSLHIFIKLFSPFGITFPYSRMEEFKSITESKNTHFFTHTVNSIADVKHAKEFNVIGFYSDSLTSVDVYE